MFFGIAVQDFEQTPSHIGGRYKHHRLDESTVRSHFFLILGALGHWAWEVLRRGLLCRAFEDLGTNTASYGGSCKHHRSEGVAVRLRFCSLGIGGV